MSGHLSPGAAAGIQRDEQDELRLMNRSPHPYHHQSSELPYLSDRFALRNGSATSQQPGNGKKPSTTRLPSFNKESSPGTGSESGTEADDEHFMKGLPAPKAKLHKGLRGRNEPLSGTSTPIPSPAIFEEPDKQLGTKTPTSPAWIPEKRRRTNATRRKKLFARRAAEACLVATLGILARCNRTVSVSINTWAKDLQSLSILCSGLLALYPLRILSWHFQQRGYFSGIPFRIPSGFDPAPILYPPAVTLLVSLLISPQNPGVVLPNIVLSICSLPQQLVPKVDQHAAFDTLHWVISFLPLTWPSSRRLAERLAPSNDYVSVENLLLLYPLHRTLCVVLHDLTTTSLLTAELQLFSIALINILILASSPQMQILKALLWVGGLGVLISCGPVIRSGITLARVPKWRFRPATPTSGRSVWKDLIRLMLRRRTWDDALNSPLNDQLYDSQCSSDDDGGYTPLGPVARVQTLGPDLDVPADRTNDLNQDTASAQTHIQDFEPLARRHTLSYVDQTHKKRHLHTPSGRRKRATSVSLRPYLKLTYTQAVWRKRLYAVYVYAAMLAVIFVGVRLYIQRYALNGSEPIGWGLGYAFGNLPKFRFEVVYANLERWICLPSRVPVDEGDKECHNGWVQHLRHNEFGEANTRLMITGYWLGVFVLGLIVVLRLKDIYEVDTRRKVFHFMMVGMFIPTAFIDPAYAALALSLVLAVFLMLDLLRASQLPPLSKPIASFLAPYVDGRDFRGPVVISHIFLLIGCAIPLWLSLAALPRTGSGYWAGWELPTRDVSMVSGVICVGLGDAAASLIGRRYGHRKWLWGGGKSLEGSLAFAVAVFVGLGLASCWLRIGGWPVTGTEKGVFATAGNAALCASMSSLTEAVLTGGNDNVIVPVVLWTCVKSLEI